MLHSSVGVARISVYAFSTGELNRSADEVKQLMKLFLWVFQGMSWSNLKTPRRFAHVLSATSCASELRRFRWKRAIHQAEEETQFNTRGTLLFCLDYGGQQEIVDAMKQLASS